MTSRVPVHPILAPVVAHVMLVECVVLVSPPLYLLTYTSKDFCAYREPTGKGSRPYPRTLLPFIMKCQSMLVPVNL